MAGQNQNQDMHIFRASLLTLLLYTINFSFAKNVPERVTHFHKVSRVGAFRLKINLFSPLSFTSKFWPIRRFLDIRCKRK